MGILESFIQTGCISLDKLLGGGFPTGSISLIYGEAETGKTSLAIQCVVNCARKGFKSLFIDNDGNFSYERLSQIAKYDYERISPLIIIIRPNTFQEQSRAIDQLEKVVSKKFGLIVVDTLTSLYCVETDSKKGTFAVNRELNRQLAVLTQIAKTLNLAVIINSQVRSFSIKEKTVLRPVAMRVQNFWSDIVIDMKKTGQSGVVQMLREKHPKIEGKGTIYVKLDNTGIIDYKH